MRAKLVIYAICKNETKNIKAFLEVVQEADYIRVIDTGSSDNTVDMFIKEATALGLEDKFSIQTADIQPFSFSVARNLCMQYAKQTTDAEWFVFLDLDERMDRGWTNAVQESIPQFGQNTPCSLFFTMQLVNEDKEISVSYTQQKAHTREGFRWAYSAHEVLVTDETPHSLVCPIYMSHEKDESKERTYLPLLATDFEDNPNDHRACFYYGRELYYAGEYDKALDVLSKAHGAMTGYYDAQHVELLRIMFYCSKDLRFLYSALSINPEMRELYYELAVYHRDIELYYSAIGFLEILLQSVEQNNFILFKDPGVYTWKPYDLLSECLWHTGNVLDAYANAIKALNANPMNQRLQTNVQYYMKYLRSNSSGEQSGNQHSDKESSDSGVGVSESEAKESSGVVATSEPHSTEELPG